jgi:hypothetical protein
MFSAVLYSLRWKDSIKIDDIQVDSGEVDWTELGCDMKCAFLNVWVLIPEYYL